MITPTHQALQILRSINKFNMTGSIFHVTSTFTSAKQMLLPLIHDNRYNMNNFQAY